MANRYTQIIETIFHDKYEEGKTVLPFARDEIVTTAARLGIELPKNLGDIVYSFKFRADLPASIQDTAPENLDWVIVPKGRAQYAFELLSMSRILPDHMLPVIKVPDATPGIVSRYALDDEQALLTKVRYNRLIDIFTGITCYSIQNHLRTTINGIGQVETDEIYVGVDKKGVHYVFPVQAKGGTDEIGIVQIMQDLALCNEKFPELEPRAIAAQFLTTDNVIALFAFGLDPEEHVVKLGERHYKLVPPEALSEDELRKYREMPDS